MIERGQTLLRASRLLSRHGLLLVAGLLPSGLMLAWALFLRLSATWSGSPFDLFGSAAITIKVTLYACAGLLLAYAILHVEKRKGVAWVPACAALAILGADQTPRPVDIWGYSYMDSAIWRIGYLVSRIAPPRPSDGQLVSKATPALPPLTRVDARTLAGGIQIRSGKGRLRPFTWDGVTRTLELLPPETGSGAETCFYTRRFDSDGVRQPWFDWAEHKGIVRGEYWEGVQEFQSQAEAEAWLARKQDQTMPFVWTHDGLVVGWSTGVDWRSLTVECYQMLVGGKKPVRLEGSIDRDLVVNAEVP